MEHGEFHEIYEEYVRQVYYFLLSLSGNPDTAEELTQETFVKAYTNLDNFRGDCRLYVWLCQIGKNLYFNYMKKENRHAAVNEVIHTYSDGKSVEEEVLAADSARELIRAVSNLAEPYQSIFVYHVFSQLTYKEIGEILQKSENWVRVTYYRAKKKLQVMIKEAKLYEV